MKEFGLSLTEGLQKGLRPAQTGSRNSGLLTQAKNLRPTVGGLWRTTEPTQIVGLTAAWPFPQVVVTSQRQYICTSTSVYQINSNGTLSAKILGTTGHRWSVIDYIDYELWTNGSIGYYRRASDGAFVAVGSDIPIAGLYCDFDGQGFAAGMPASWYGGRDNVIAWSRVGAADFTMPSSGTLDRHYTMGYMGLRQNGPIYALKVAGQHLVAYTASGISIIQRPTSYSIKTSAGWGQKDFKPIPVDSYGAVCGDRTNHYFVDKSGTLYKLTANNELSVLGYREFFQNFSDVVLSYNPSLEEVIISDASQHYIYSGRTGQLTGPMDYGLQGVHTTWGSNDTAGMLVTTPSSSWTYEESQLTSSIVDFGSVMVKSIEQVEVAGELPRDTQVCTWFRFNRRNPFKRTPWVPLAEGGVGFPRTAGIEFKFSVKSRTRPFLVDGMSVRFKQDDRRFVRGTSVSL